MANNEEENKIEKINLRELNACIEENRKNMIITTDYDFLEQISELMLQKNSVDNEKIVEPVIIFSREKAISIVLNFFNSLGNKEWYEKAKNIILGQNKNIGINIFTDEDIIDVFEEDKDGFYKYSYGSEVEFKEDGSKALVKVLLNDEFSDVIDYIPANKFTIQDIYDIVHEISHTFDLGNNKKSIDARQLFTEITPYCFEKMLGDYLEKNNIVNRIVVDKIARRRTNISCRRAREVFTKINLIKLKEKEETLTKNNIKRMLEQKGINNTEYVRATFRDILLTIPSIDYDARYPIAELTAHKYMKLYREDEKETIERLKKYCEEIKRGNSNDEVLTLVGCPINSEQVLKIVNDIRDSRNR